MSKFAKSWVKRDEPSFTTKIKETINPPGPLKPRLDGAGVERGSDPWERAFRVGAVQQLVGRRSGDRSRVRGRAAIENDEQLGLVHDCTGPGIRCGKRRSTG